MICFVDASALVALMENEADRPMIADRLRASSRRLWSAMSYWETVSALQRSYERPAAVARVNVAAYAESLALEMVAIGGEELATALDAYQTYGKGRHLASLNMGDCFAYACAKTNGAQLLYKGDDFSQTDLA